MASLAEIVRYLGTYLGRLLKIWVLWIFVLLDVLGLIVDMFVPEISLPWWLYWLIAGVGFCGANVRLLLDCEDRLAEYEEQAPEYELEVSDVGADVCRQACHFDVECTVTITPTTQWIGYLAKPTVDRENSIQGLGDWYVERVGYSDRCTRISDWPFQIPDRVLDLRVHIRCKTSDQIDSSQADEWAGALLRLNLQIGRAMPRGGVATKMWGLDVDLRKALGRASAIRKGAHSQS